MHGVHGKMEFYGLILFMILATALLIRSFVAAVDLFTRSPRRWRGFGLCLGGWLLLAIFMRHLYQAFWLDERLFIAAAQGDAVGGRALLSSGASPDAAWEDGTSALSAAQRGGHRDVETLLKQAGATR